MVDGRTSTAGLSLLVVVEEAAGDDHDDYEGHSHVPPEHHNLSTTLTDQVILLRGLNLALNIQTYIRC